MTYCLENIVVLLYTSDGSFALNWGQSFVWTGLQGIRKVMEHLPQTEPGQDEMEDKVAFNEVCTLFCSMVKSWQGFRLMHGPRNKGLQSFLLTLFACTCAGSASAGLHATPDLLEEH